jgi:predicted component of viral defense system (DUF524 family)
LAALASRAIEDSEQQLEFLRHTLQSKVFLAALEEVARNPHRRLEDEIRHRRVGAPIKATKSLARGLMKNGPRVPVPTTHPIHHRCKFLPREIRVNLRKETTDTVENRFIKLILVEFREAVLFFEGQLSKDFDATGRVSSRWLAEEAARLLALLQTQLGRSFFLELPAPAILPLGSPVLQRRPGYRELYRLWLGFHANLQMQWPGATDLFRAGARNVAALYEYWLFFQVEALFRRKFGCSQLLHATLINRSKSPPSIELKRGVEIPGAILGNSSSSSGLKLRASLLFNKTFHFQSDSFLRGSWSRGFRPDFTISIWQAESAGNPLSSDEAERSGRLIHLHFDAKYRAEKVTDVFGSASENEGSTTLGPKYSDLLKMHAYKDAVRRTAGAFVLYPGSDRGEHIYSEFPDRAKILPAIGAFSIRPDSNGDAIGIESLGRFLDTVVHQFETHLSI